jgi:hypothetical protein
MLQPVVERAKARSRKGETRGGGQRFEEGRRCIMSGPAMWGGGVIILLFSPKAIIVPF